MVSQFNALYFKAIVYSHTSSIVQRLVLIIFIPTYEGCVTYLFIAYCVTELEIVFRCLIFIDVER